MRILQVWGKQLSELFHYIPDLLLARYFNYVRELQPLFLLPPEHLEKFCRNSEETRSKQGSKLASWASICPAALLYQFPFSGRIKRTEFILYRIFLIFNFGAICFSKVLIKSLLCTSSSQLCLKSEKIEVATRGQNIKE